LLGSAATLLVLLVHAPSSQAAQWTRSQGGVVVDVLDLNPKGDGYSIALREGFGKPAYASGFCIATGDKTICSVLNVNGKAGLIELSPRGTGLHYRSYYDEGATKWEGEFVSSQGTAAPVKTTPSAPPAAGTGRLTASQWTRSEGGAIVDVLNLTPQDGGYQIALREGFGKPVYSSGSCTVSENTITCDSRTTKGQAGRIVLTLRGNTLHYRSAYDGGRSTWEGDFVRSEIGR